VSALSKKNYCQAVLYYKRPVLYCNGVAIYIGPYFTMLVPVVSKSQLNYKLDNQTLLNMFVRDIELQPVIKNKNYADLGYLICLNHV